MIKKLKYWLLLLCGLFFWINGFVNAMQDWVVHEIWHTYSSVIDNSHIEMGVLPKGSFISRYFWQWKAVFSPVAIKWSENDSDISRIIYFFWNNKKPYLYLYSKNANYLFFNQGYLTKYKVCDYFTDAHPLNCSDTSITSEWDIELLTSFLSTVSLDNDYYYYYTNIDWIVANQPYLQLCISSYEYDSSICFEAGCTNYSTSSACQQLTGSLWLMPNLSYSDLSSYLLDNPPTLPQNSDSSENVGVIGGDDIEWFNYYWTDEENLVSYFENNPYYKFDENVCYVWTNDFSLYYNMWNNPIFYKWQGDNIFDLYSFLFWNNYTTKQVWMFINAWSTNYLTWFQWKNRDEWWEVDWLAWYSHSSWYYQVWWTWQYDPFYWERLAVYFMGMNTSSYMKLQSTLWEEIATYCYYKLQGDVNSWYNVTDNSDESYWNNAGEFSQNLRRFKTYFSGSDSIQSQSWDWTPLDWLYSGDNDLDFSTFFSKSFNRFKNVFTLDRGRLWTWIIPWYIIIFLLAMALFRFLRK